MADGEELPPVVIPLEGRDQEFLDMLVRDEEALAAFAENANAILGDIGGLTFSGAQISSEGVGAAGEVIGEQLSAGISEGAGSLNLGVDLAHSLGDAAETGLVAGEQIGEGLIEGIAGAGDAAGAAVAAGFDEGVSGIGASAVTHLGEQFAQLAPDVAHEASAAFAQAFTDGMGSSLSTIAVGSGVVARLAATFSDGATEAGAAAGDSLIAALGDAAAQNAADAAVRATAGLEAAMADTMALAGADAGDAFSQAFAASVQIDATVRDALTAANIQGIVAEQFTAAGQVGAQAIETGFDEAASVAVQSVADAQMQLDAAWDRIYAGGAGTTARLTDAMRAAFEGIEADTAGFSDVELRIFDNFYATLQQKGEAAALDMAERTRIISSFAASGPVGDFNTSSIGQPFPTAAVAGEAAAAANATDKVGVAAKDATEALGGMAGMMGGQWLWGVLGAVSILPMFSGLLGNSSQAAQQAAQDQAALQQAIAQDSNMVGANTVSVIANQLATSGAADALSGYGISLAEATAAMAGNKDAQDAVSGSIDAQITNLQALIQEQTAHSQGVSDDIQNERQQVEQLEATRDAMKGLEQDVVNAVAKQNELAQATLYASQAVDVFSVQVRAGVLSLQQQAEQADVSAQATAAWMMSLVPGSQAYTAAVNDQIVALEHSALSAQINAQALNESLPLQEQIGAAALQAADDYTQAATATGQYTNAVNGLFGQYGATSQAQAAFTTALDGLKGNITSGTSAVDLNTAAGSKNFTAFQQVAQAAEAASEKIYQQTGDTTRAAQALQDMANKLDTAAYNAGLTKTQVQQLNTELFGTPSIKDIAISLTGVQAAKDILNGLTNPRDVFINAEINDINNSSSSSSHSGLKYNASGGPAFANIPQVVGDGGRSELFVPNSNGYVFPSVDSGLAALAGAYGGGGGQGMTVVQVYLDGEPMTRGVRSTTRYYANRNATTGFN
jgi:hypothetical protein